MAELKSHYRQAPRVAVWSEDLPWVPLGTVTDNSKDQGLNKRLITPEINGSPDVEFFFGLTRWPPGDYHPLHRHPGGAEFYYVLSGTGKMQCGDEVIDAKPGLALYIPRNVPHAVRADGDVPLEIAYGFSPSDRDAVGLVWLE